MRKSLWQQHLLLSCTILMLAASLAKAEAQEKILESGASARSLNEQKLNIKSIRVADSANFVTPITKIKSINQINHPATSVQLLTPMNQVAQSPVVDVTGVKANPTDKGVEVILQTDKGKQLQVTNRSTGNSFIVDIPNAQLRLPSGEAFTFRSEKPLAGITEITVINIDSNTIRVTVTGEASLPNVELFDADEGLIFGVARVANATPPPQQPTPPVQQPTQIKPSQPSAQDDEPIELVVTGEQDGYRVPDASTATRTDTPIRDIPQSIQVVPQQVLEDQQAIRASEALRNVSGIQRSGTGYGNSEAYTIRGFLQNGANLRDGFRENILIGLVETANLERIEVLKGPA